MSSHDDFGPRDEHENQDGGGAGDDFGARDAYEGLDDLGVDDGQGAYGDDESLEDLEQLGVNSAKDGSSGVVDDGASGGGASSYFARAVVWTAATLGLVVVAWMVLYVTVFRQVSQTIGNEFFVSPAFTWMVAWGVTAALLTAFRRFLPTAFLGVNAREGWKAYFVMTGLLFAMSFSWGAKQYFDENGESQGYVHWLPEGPVILEAAKHPVTGRDGEPLTPESHWDYEVAKQYPTDLDAPPIQPGRYFDESTGMPVVWYTQPRPGVYDLFPRPGFDPRTSARRMPITADIVNDPVNQLRIYNFHTGLAEATSGDGVMPASSLSYADEPPVYWGDDEEESGGALARADDEAEKTAAVQETPAPPAPPAPRQPSEVQPTRAADKAESSTGTVQVSPPPASRPQATAVAPPRSTATATVSPPRSATAPSAPSEASAQRRLAPVPGDRASQAAARDRELESAIQWPGR